MYKNPFTDFLKKRNERKPANSIRSQFHKYLDVYCIRNEFQINAVTTASLCLSPQPPVRWGVPFVARGMAVIPHSPWSKMSPLRHSGADHGTEKILKTLMGRRPSIKSPCEPRWAGLEPSYAPARPSGQDRRAWWPVRPGRVSEGRGPCRGVDIVLGRMVRTPQYLENHQSETSWNLTSLGPDFFSQDKVHTNSFLPYNFRGPRNRPDAAPQRLPDPS